MQISGIQQLGIGIPKVHEAFAWYRRAFGMDIKVFEEAAVADLMLPYTGNSPQARHAILALNMQGGSGFEIWQYSGRTPQAPTFEIGIGDLGIYAGRIKSRDIQQSHKHLSGNMNSKCSSIQKDPIGKEHFYCWDPYGNIFEITPFDNWFSSTSSSTGGGCGAILGVSDIEKSKSFYKEVLGYDMVVFEEEGMFEDFKALPKGEHKCKRVRLAHSKKRRGPFSELLGSSELELIESANPMRRKIYENRFWGDLGFIHLCYDIRGMDALREVCEKAGAPFTVDSSTAHLKGFDMGEAAGHFSYVEDPDGTLIEFVETHKVPVAKKLGWYLNLRKRSEEKSLPRWMIKAMSLNRVRD